MGPDDRYRENAIEWLPGEKTAGVTTVSKKIQNKIRKLKEKFPDAVEIVTDDEGVMFAHVPVSWVRISPPRQGRAYTEEEKAQAAERLRLAREKRNGSETDEYGGPEAGEDSDEEDDEEESVN